MDYAHPQHLKTTAPPLSVFTIRVGDKEPRTGPRTAQTLKQELELPPLNYAALLSAARQPRQRRYRKTLTIDDKLVRSPTASLPDLAPSPLQSLLYGSKPCRVGTGEDAARAASRVARAAQRSRWRLAREWDPMSSPLSAQPMSELPHVQSEASSIATAPLSSSFLELSSTQQLASTLPSSHVSATPSTPTPQSQAEMAEEVSAAEFMLTTAAFDAEQSPMCNEPDEMPPSPMRQQPPVDARTFMLKVSDLPPPLLVLVLSFLAGDTSDGGDRFWVTLLVASGLAQQRARVVQAKALNSSGANLAQSASEEYTVATLLELSAPHHEHNESDGLLHSVTTPTWQSTFGGADSMLSSEIRPSFERSGGVVWPLLGVAWQRFVANERASRAAALTMGDFSVDLECSIWPTALGDVEHDPPVWVRDPESDQEWQAERLAHDQLNYQEHRHLLAKLLAQMDNFLAGRLIATEQCSEMRNTETSNSTNGSPRQPLLSSMVPKEPLKIIAAPLVVFGGGAAVVQMLLESLTLSCAALAPSESLLFASAPTDLSSLEVSQQQQQPRLKPPSLSKSASGVEVGLCLSGCGSRVTGDMLANTALNPQRGLAAVLVSLELRGLSLSLTTYISRNAEAVHSLTPGGSAEVTTNTAPSDFDQHEAKVTPGLSTSSRTSASPSRQSRHPLSPTASLSAAADAAADAVATALIDDAAANFLALLGDCPCLNLLDLSSVNFTINQTIAGSSERLPTEPETKAGGSLAPPMKAPTTVPEREYSCGLSDAAVAALGRALALRRSIRKLAIGSAPRVTDAGLRAIGESIGRQLTDVSLYGCYRISDIGVMHIARSNLLRANYCGCYKVTDAGLRQLISANPRILTYNKARDFGRPHPQELNHGLV